MTFYEAIKLAGLIKAICSISVLEDVYPWLKKVMIFRLSDPLVRLTVSF